MKHFFVDVMSCDKRRYISWPSRARKKNSVGISVGIFEYFWHPCSKCILMFLRRIGVAAKSGNAPKSQN